MESSKGCPCLGTRSEETRTAGRRREEAKVMAEGRMKKQKAGMQIARLEKYLKENKKKLFFSNLEGSFN